MTDGNISYLSKRCRTHNNAEDAHTEDKAKESAAEDYYGRVREFAPQVGINNFNAL